MSAVGELIHAGSLPCRATPLEPVSATLPPGLAISVPSGKVPGLRSIGRTAVLQLSKSRPQFTRIDVIILAREQRRDSTLPATTLRCGVDRAIGIARFSLP